MSETKFTPGPWYRIQEREHHTTANDGHDLPKWGVYDNHQAWCIASTGSTWPTEEEEDANAALIAAAPKMYRELESTATMLDALADQLEDQTRHDDLEDLPDDMLSATEGMRVHAAVIRELLAQARGKEGEEMDAEDVLLNLSSFDGQIFLLRMIDAAKPFFEAKGEKEIILKAATIKRRIVDRICSELKEDVNKLLRRLQDDGKNGGAR